MSGVSLSINMVLPPIEGVDYFTRGREAFLEILEASPQLHNHSWDVEIMRHPSGGTQLRVRAVDRSKPSPDENVKLVAILIFIMVVIGILAYT